MRNSFSIRDIAVELGEKKLAVRDFGSSYSSVTEKTGIEYVFESRRSALQLAVAAVDAVASRNNDRLGNLAYLIVVSQSPTAILPGMASSVQFHCKLPEQLCAIDMNEGCAGFVQALSLVARILQGDSQFDALIVCTDTYRAKLQVDDRSTNSLFSDGATATWICGGGDLMIVAEQHLSRGAGAGLLHQTINDDGSVGRLQMSGPDVLMFTQRNVPRHIFEVLAKAGMSIDEVDKIYLHQASKLVLDSISAKLGSSVAMPSNLREVGNLVSSSIPALLADDWFRTEEGVMVMSGFGVGLSMSTVVVKKS